MANARIIGHRNYNLIVGLHVASQRLVQEVVRIREEAVNRLVTHDCSGYTNARNLFRGGFSHYKRIFVKDGEVGKKAFLDGPQSVINLVLPSGHGSNGMDSLKDIKTLIIVPIGLCNAGILTGFQSNGISRILAAARNDGSTFPHLRLGRYAGNAGSYTLERRDRGDHGIIVKTELLPVISTVLCRTDLIGATRAKEDILVTVAIEVGMGREIRVEDVLLLHPVRKDIDVLRITRLTVEEVHGRYARLHGAIQLHVHFVVFGLIAELIIQSHLALDLLAFQELSVDDSMAGILDIRVLVFGDDFFQTRDPGFARSVAVQMHLCTLSI